MAYLFGAANTDKINCGTAVAKANTFTLWLRLAPTAANTTDRVLAVYSNGSTRYYFYLNFATGVTNLLAGGMSVNGGAGSTAVTWETGWTAGSLHTIAFVYDGANQIFYADTDATAKATSAETGVPDQDAGITFILGNETAVTSRAAGSTIYEAAWWAGTVLTGAQCAQLGAGYDALFLHPKPSSHWRLVGDAADTVGGQHGTVTGATLAAHTARIYRPAPRSRVAFTPAGPTHVDPTFTVGARTEMISAATLAGLGGTTWFWQDSGIGTLNNGDGTYSFFASVGGGGHVGAPGKLVGTMSNPLSVSHAETTISGRKDAPDSVAADFQYQGGGPVYKDPASGMLIVFAHCERSLGPFTLQYYSWLGVLKSTDGGNAWTDCGTIVTPFHTYDEMAALYTSFGKGDGTEYSADVGWGAYVIVGAYFYVYYWNCDAEITSSGVFGGGACVARALISEVIAAAATGDVSVWHKWNGTDWSELGIHGHGTTVYGAHHWAVSYNTFRHKYIMVDAFGGTGSDTNRIVQYRESTDGLTWSSPPEWFEVTGTPKSPLHIYPSLVDPSSLVPYQTGQAFYLIAKNWVDFPVDRFLITLNADPSDAARLLTVLAPHAGGRGE